MHNKILPIVIFFVFTTHFSFAFDNQQTHRRLTFRAAENSNNLEIILKNGIGIEEGKASNIRLENCM